MTLILGRFMDRAPEEETAAADRNAQAPAESTPAPAESTPAPVESTLEPAKVPEITEQPDEEIFFGYARGQQIPMEEVNDDTFANKVLGDGAAVLPEEGKVYAPADGVITSIFDTKHAICFTSSQGTEILIHIGVDTVNLQGKYFTAHVKDGDAVKRGQLLIEFDKEQIEKAGYDTVIPMIFTDLPEDRKLEVASPGAMSPDTRAAVLRKA